MRDIKEDARIKKTKEKLKESFTELLKIRKFEDITVNEICSVADVRRATFYKHFSDKNDFLAYYVSSMRDAFSKSAEADRPELSTAEKYTNYVSGFVDFLDENTPLMESVFRSEAADTVIEVILRENLRGNRMRFDLAAAKGVRLPASAETVANLLTGGLTTVVLKWVRDGKPIPKETLMNDIGAIISALIEREI